MDGKCCLSGSVNRESDQSIVLRERESLFTWGRDWQKYAAFKGNIALTGRTGESNANLTEGNSQQGKKG